MKKSILVFIIFSACFVAEAQILVKSTSQALIEQALRNSILEIEQSYQLLDTITNKKYGLKGSETFGSCKGLCIKGVNGYYVPSDVITPWENDDNFKRYKDKYVPVRIAPKFHNFYDDKSFAAGVIADTSVVALCSSPYVFVSDSTFADNSGLAVDYTCGAVEGWIICVLQDKGSHVNTFKEDVLIDTTRTACKVKAYMPQNALGGIFVTVSSTGMGTLSFKLCGVLSKITEEWQIEFPFTENVQSGSTDELSPVVEATEVVKTIEGEVADKKDVTDSKKKNKHSK